MPRPKSPFCANADVIAADIARLPESAPIPGVLARANVSKGRNTGATVACVLVFGLIAAFLLPGCGPTPVPTPVPPAQASPSPAAAATSLFSQDIAAAEAGQAVLALRAAGPGTSWGKSGAEAATLAVYLDGSQRADVVLFGGESGFTYTVLLGALQPGSHRLELREEPAKSAARAAGARVDEATVRIYATQDPLYQVLAHAPIIYGREESRYSDTPLFMYYETSGQAAARTIQYTVIFSNEDGGTAADGLMARWGRLTDIEWVYRVVVDQTGNAVREEYQDKDHGTSLFQGQHDGQHPLLRDATRNNLFADSGTSSYRFALAPLENLTAGSREEIMDLHPWMYQVMSEEWQREGQSQTEKSANPSTRAVSDPRNYLYVEFRSGPQPGLVCDAKLAFAAKLRGSETWYSSDHGEDSLRIQNNNGWRRGAIELPPGTKAEHVDALRFAVYPGKQQPPCALLVNGVRKVFVLGQDYAPGASILSWSGEQALDADPATPLPESLTLSP